MSTIVEYTVITKADTIIKDELGFYSTQDGYQQQASFNNGGTDPTANVIRLDFMLKPTASANPIANRVVDINLESMQVDYVRIIHAKSDKYFLIATSDTLANLSTTSPELVKVSFKDFGVQPNPISGFTPFIPYPKYIRLINPLEINGGGSGNDIGDTPIQVSLHLITNKFNT